MSPTNLGNPLSPEQEALLAATRDEWIEMGSSTTPTDRARAEAAVRLAYRRAGRSTLVRVIWAASPLAAAGIAASLIRRAHEPRQPVDLVAAAMDVIARRAQRLVGAGAAQVELEVASAVAAHVVRPVWTPIDQAVRRQAEQPRALRGYAQPNASRLAYFDALGRCGLDVSELDGVTDLARVCAWWWSFTDACVVSERPVTLSRDEHGRLHQSSGPAAVFGDGWSVYGWHGVRVPAATIVEPESITIAAIQREPNIEVRRVMLARYGFARYVDDSGALPIHADDTGTLYRCELGDDEPLVVVSLMNSTSEPDGSRKRYVVRVPPDVTQARQAVAWTFDRDADRYSPVQET